MDELFAPGQPLPGQPQPNGNNGLLSDNMKPSGAAPGKQILEYDEEAVTEEEQSIYDQFVYRAQEFMTKAPEDIIDQMNNSRVPVFQNVGKTAVMIGQGIIKTAEAAGQEISPDVIFHGGQEIIEMLMELGGAAGIFPFKEDSKEFEEAQAMAFMHGAEILGKETLAGPNKDQNVEDAGNHLAMQIAGEQERGEVAPGFFEGIEQGVVNGASNAAAGV